MQRQLARGLLLACLGAACGSDQDASPPAPAASGPQPPAVAGAAASATGGAPAAPAATQGGAVVQIGGSAGMPAPAPVCASVRAEADLVPLHLAFAFDVSGSMGKGDKPWHDRTLKWEPVVTATRSFLESPAATGLTASMTFFPEDGGEDERCDDAAYVEPDVAMTPLPSSDFGLALDAIGSEDWRGGTPTLHVLRGIYRYIEQRQLEQPGKYVAVLVTDGYPQDCDDDEIAALVELVGTASATVATYVIGVANPPIEDAPDTVTDLEQVAVAGGTEHAHLIDTGEPENTAQKLREAIDAVRGSAISCVVDIPPAPDGRSFDKEAVVVRAQGSAATSTLDYDPSCAAGAGWHYDDPADPRRIVLCEHACDTLKVDPSARLDVEFACERVIEIPE